MYITHIDTGIFESMSYKEASCSLNESLLPGVKLIQHKLSHMSKHYGVVLESMI